MRLDQTIRRNRQWKNTSVRDMDVWLSGLWEFWLRRNLKEYRCKHNRAVTHMASLSSITAVKDSNSAPSICQPQPFNSDVNPGSCNSTQRVESVSTTPKRSHSPRPSSRLSHNKRRCKDQLNDDIALALDAWYAQGRFTIPQVLGWVSNACAETPPRRSSSPIPRENDPLA